MADFRAQKSSICRRGLLKTRVAPWFSGLTGAPLRQQPVNAGAPSMIRAWSGAICRPPGRNAYCGSAPAHSTVCRVTPERCWTVCLHR